MSHNIEREARSGPRYLVSLEVRAEWDDADGSHIVVQGTTENVGPEGALVHLPRQLPSVGSTVRLEVAGEDGQKLKVIAETNEWKGLIWESAAPLVSAPPVSVEDEDDEEEDDDFAN